MEHIGKIMGTSLIGTEEPKALETSSPSPKLHQEIFSKGMAILLSHFPKTEIPKDRAKIMFEFLSDLTEEQYVLGIKRFCKEHKEIYPNTNLIAYIREYGVINELAFLSSSEAWEMVLKEMGRVGGAYGSPNPPSALVKKAIDGIGWKDLCLSENVDVIRGQFRKIYEQLVERKKKEMLS